MKFLQQVADYYLARGTDLHNYTFVFPNKRSALFMRKYMRSSSRRVSFMPKMVSVTFFTQSFCKSVLASPYELLFMLYGVYCRVLEKHGKSDQIPDFDNFSFWGTILLNDFSEVDAYLTDPDKLFRNLAGLNEISANYLTDEQLKAIRLLGGKGYAWHADTEQFWKHVPHNPDKGSLSDQFISLWMVMGELYHDFRAELASRQVPMAYSGMQSKEALENIRNMDIADFGGKRYVFVGFNVLSTARTLIFEHLGKLGIAEFFWDTAFADALAPVKPVTGRKTDNPALRFVLPLEQRFPAPKDFTAEPVQTPPDIEIVSVPSNTAQAKVASDIVKEWSDALRGTPGMTEQAYQRSLLDIAVILPDAQLLMPVLYSVPEEVKPINVTMGVSYSSTPFAALMSAIISMQMRARRSKDDYTYYYLDVQQVIMHPHIVLIAGDTTRALRRRIAEEHLYRLSGNMLRSDYPDLAFLFREVDNTRDAVQVKSYITGIIDVLAERITALTAPSKQAESYELALLDGYRKAVDTICSLAENHGVRMRDDTFFRLLEHELSSTTLNFTGQPLNGLQIMGVMDTRTLDFDNIVFLSMNEGIFPKKNYTPSLIPASLRHGFYMPTQEHEESTYAYQFYRLMSRAKRVRLLYDSRAKGLASGEMSRFISQWMHLEKEHPLKFSSFQLAATPPPAKEIVVNKTDPGVAESLARFYSGGDLFLSASALKTYLDCPMQFYLAYVKGLRVDDNVLEYIDAASYGSVLHSMAENLYNRYRNRRITPEVIDDILRMNDLERLALNELNTLYYKNRYTGALDKMPGESRLTAKVMARLIRNMLQKEREEGAFVFLDAEYGERKPLEWEIGGRSLKLHMSIDRIDMLEDGSLRFIDYKTGGDKLEASSIDDVFDNRECHGIFQVLMYCRAYRDIHKYEGRIHPKIYKFQDMAVNGLPDLVINKTHVLDDRQLDEGGDGYSSRLQDLLDRIFETANEHPFRQVPEKDCNEKCLYCSFKQFCGRHPKPPKTK